MPLTTAQISTLRTAILADTALTVHVTANNDTAIASYYSTATTTKVFRGVIPSYEVINNTVPTEWASLTADAKQRYQTLTGAGQVDTSTLNVRDAFLAMFGSTTTTRANLTNMAQRFSSRGENLLGSGVVVHHLDVAQALRG